VLDNDARGAMQMQSMHYRQPAKYPDSNPYPYLCEENGIEQSGSLQMSLYFLFIVH
jgi:hypothetical protein